MSGKKLVKMTRNDTGSEDGFTVLQLVQDEVYELDADLADALVNDRKSAVFHEEKGAKPAQKKNAEGEPVETAPKKGKGE